MSKNEGLLDKRDVGGSPVYTETHAPILMNAFLKTDHLEIEEGSVLAFEADGSVDVIKSGNTLQIAGVATESVAVGEEKSYIEYLAHGTAISSKLKGAGGAKFTDTASLAKAAIYAV